MLLENLFFWNILMTFLLHRKKIFFLPLTWLFIYFAIIPMQLANYVLCIGTDGHVGFEFAINGCCANATDQDSTHLEVTSLNASATAEGHCGECVDLPIFASLNSEPFIATIEHNLLTSLPVYTNAINSNVTISLLLPTTHISVIPSPINSALISLRTVTLLI